MSALHLDSVTFGYTSAVDVLREVSLSLAEGWHGLVGENGSGKTTLLRLVLGELEPSAGRIVIDPADALAGWCPQIVDELSPGIPELAASWEAADAAVRARLELEPEDLERWPSLSPGERRRWQLAAVLASRPDVMCVDEPTNHLDAGASDMLVEELARFRGVGIVVSHDRGLLDHLTSSTIRVSSGSVRVWNGSYTVVEREWQREEAEALELRDRLQTERARTRRRLEQRRRDGEATSKRDRGARRRGGGQDSDARSAAIKGRQARAAAVGSGAAGVDAERLERIEKRLDEVRVDRKHGGSIEIAGETASKPVLMSHLGSLKAGDQVLETDLDVVVQRESRLRVTGPNGAGKTTLMKALVETAAIEASRILWLPQELTRQERSELISRLRGLRGDQKGKVMAVAARLGLDPGRALESDEPSPGEARKLWLAEGLGRRVWVAVLDEPTNHLDLPSIRRLESALADYEGALVFATHDDGFAAAMGGRELRLG